MLIVKPMVTQLVNIEDQENFQKKSTLVMLSMMVDGDESTNGW